MYKRYIIRASRSKPNSCHQYHKQPYLGMYVQCNLDCPDLVYPEPQLSQKIHYYACTEGVINDLLWMWLHIE